MDHSYKQDGVRKMKQVFESSSISNKHGSTSLKSDISTEIGLPLSNGGIEMNGKLTRGKNVNSTENRTTNDSQHRTESSCSNSLSVIPPVSLSNQETSKEGYSFMNYTGSTDSSNIDRRSEEPATEIMGKLQEMDRELMGKDKGELIGNESSESSMIKPSKDSEKDKDTYVAGFDLNDDVNDDSVQPVMHVVAKAGVPRGPPKIPLKFEGERGWKGSAETSAFQRTSFYKSLHNETCSKNTQGFTGIDLNVDAVEDEMISSPSISQDSSSQIDSKQTKRPTFDLNCVYDAADEFPQSKSTPLLDLNVNANTFVEDGSNNFHWLGQDSAVPKRDFNLARHDYMADLSTMHHLVNNAHAQRYLATPNLPYLHPQSYPYKGPFPFGSTIPYSRYSHENGVFITNPGMGPTSLGTPHFVQVVHGQSSGNIKASTPKLDIKTEENFELMQREAWQTTLVKRKEPERGESEYYQLGYRQERFR